MNWRMIAGLLMASPVLMFAADGHHDARVFEGLAAVLAERLNASAAHAGEPVRTLLVEERVGEARHAVLVRVPLFLHAGECEDPQGFMVRQKMASGLGPVIPYQADDVRRDPDGHVSRMHLYFEVEMKAWERKRYVLVKGHNPVQPKMKMVERDGAVTFVGAGIEVSFRTTGPRAGAIVGIKTPLGKVNVGADGLGPKVALLRQAADTKPVRTTVVGYDDPTTFEVRELRWDAGSLFSKLVVRIGPPGLPDNAEYTYLVPRHGSAFIQQERLFPSNPDDLEVVGTKEQTLLGGELTLGAKGQRNVVVAVPTGLRMWTRDVIGDKDDALVNAAAELSLYPVPYVQTDVGEMTEVGDRFALAGTKNFFRTVDGLSDGLRQFWSQAEFCFSNAVDGDGLWRVGKQHFQPLTAVVDEPGVTVADLHEALKGVALSRTEVSWAQSAGAAYVEEDDAGVKSWIAKGPAISEDGLVAEAMEARRKIEATLGGKPIPQDKITAAAGPLDAYMITQARGPYAFLASAGYETELLTKDALAVARASRTINGKVNEYGFPYINEFFSAFNMQGGSIILGLYGAKKTGDLELLQYYRDVARGSSVLDIYGHGQRSYRGNATNVIDRSDMLYEGVSDLWLRSAALVAGEDLWQHPAVFGRFADAVDVNADLYDRMIGPPHKYEYPSSLRANMFRTQTQDHRWGGWLSAPAVGLIGHAEEGGRDGLTEAAYWVHTQVGHWVNWPDITMFFLTDIAARKLLGEYVPERAPALPLHVKVTPGDEGNTVTWDAVPGTMLGYRIYRADRVGGPITFVNSPYWPTPGRLAVGTRYVDKDGKPGQVYFVTAVDTKRRESRWFPDEPLPQAGTRRLDVRD